MQKPKLKKYIKIDIKDLICLTKKLNKKADEAALNTNEESRKNRLVAEKHNARWARDKQNDSF